MRRAGFWLVVAAGAVSSVLSVRGVYRERHQPPLLALIIVVDQLRTDYLMRFADLYEGGLKTLVEEGAYFTNSAYRHAATYTTAGHASVSTGLHPSSHGMINNSWYDPGKDEVVNCIADDQYEAVGGAGIRSGRYAGAVGPEDIAPTLARLLRVKMPTESDTRVLVEALE